MEIRLPVWFAHEKGYPRFVDIIAIGPRSAKGGVLVRANHIVRGSDNCFRCGRNITNDASKLVGYGPDCCEQMGIPRPTLETAMATLDALKAQLGTTLEFWMPGYLLDRSVPQDVQETLPRFGGAAAPAPAPKPAERAPAQPAGVVREISLDGETFHFRFSYDGAIKDQIKAAGGRWDGERGPWGTPSHWTARVTGDSQDLVASLVQRNSFTATPEALARALAGQRVAAPVAGSLAESTTWTTKHDYLRTLRPYQVAGVEFMSKNVLANRGVYNGDVMGLGKTVEMIVTLHETQAYPAIIVTTASTKLNWAKEFNAWLGNKVTVAVLNGHATTPVREADVVIINYDILDKWMDVLLGLKAKAIVFDEAQKLKNCDLQRTADGTWQYKTQRVQAASVLARTIPLRYMLSGTAVKNRPYELISQLDILGRLRDLGGRNQFKDMFCDPKVKTSKRGRPVVINGSMLMDYSGASNVAELNRRMRESFYIRREREQVLTELPAKTRMHYELSLSNRDEYDQAEADVLDAIENKEPGATLKKFGVLRQVAVRGMLDDIREWMDTFFEQEEHLILFCWHNEVADLLAEAFDAPKIVGSTSLPKRQQIIDEFQAGQHRLVVANIQAGGEGITLTRSHHVAFVELAWTPADHEQAESRAHRFGQQEAVTCHYFTAPDTIYDDIWTLLRSKWAVTDQVNIGSLAGYGLGEVEVKRRVLEQIRQRVARRRQA